MKMIRTVILACIILLVVPSIGWAILCFNCGWYTNGYYPCKESEFPATSSMVCNRSNDLVQLYSSDEGSIQAFEDQIAIITTELLTHTLCTYHADLRSNALNAAGARKTEAEAQHVKLNGFTTAHQTLHEQVLEQLPYCPPPGQGNPSYNWCHAYRIFAEYTYYDGEFNWIGSNVIYNRGQNAHQSICYKLISGYQSLQDAAFATSSCDWCDRCRQCPCDCSLCVICGEAIPCGCEFEP